MDGAALDRLVRGRHDNALPETRTVNRSSSNLIVALLLVPTLFSLSAAAQTTADPPRPAERGTANHSAHVRSGPGPRFGGLWWIDNGERVTIGERRAGWARIRFSGGRAGWIDERNIDPDERAQPAVTPISRVPKAAQNPTAASTALGEQPANQPVADRAIGVNESTGPTAIR